MSYVAIIAEFNPFTNGHEYIIHEAKKKTGLDVICLMSGNFVQRGEMACIDKYTRATHAINAGASMVFEMPLTHSASSADDFGKGAVKCLGELNNVSHLAFGVETNNTDFLMKLARFKACEPESFKNNLKSFIKNGDSYAVASFKAYNLEFKDSSNELEEIFNSPNNILALTYLSAIYTLKLDIIPVFIQRQDNGYNSNNKKIVDIDNKKVCFASASHIRNLILNQEIEKTKELVPEFVYNDLISLSDKSLKKKMAMSETLFMSKLREKTATDLNLYFDYNEGLAHLIHKASISNGDYKSLINASVSKAYRESRIKKLVAYPYFNLTKTIVKKTKETPSVLNLLATKEEKKKAVSEIKKSATAKIIISKKDFDSLTNEEKEILFLNQKGTDLYNLASSLPASMDKTIFIK